MKRKQIVSLLLTLVMVLTLMPVSVGAVEDTATNGTCGDNLIWQLDGNILRISGSGQMESYSMYNVAPWYNLGIDDRITSVILDTGVTNIGDSAFLNCHSLTNIAIPDSVTNIGDSAFMDCRGLTNIVIPDSVTRIGENAFEWCDSLTSIVIPEGITSIKDFTFSFCSNLTTITIPDSVTSIGTGAFYYCDNLTSVMIPDSVISIEEYAFENCPSIAHIYYGGSEAQWRKITGPDILAGLRAEIHYNWSGNRSDVPSSWAVDEVEAARENGLIPEELDEKYQENITRQEFCRLAVQLLETVIGRNIDEILDYHDVEINPNEFNDTKDQNILAMRALHVVSGVGDGKFESNRAIEREEAATMLTRLGKVLDGKLPQNAMLNFADKTSVSDWAYYSVMFVSNNEDENGRAIMGGTGDNQFSPQETYTREQAFLSFGRLYDIVEKCTIGQLRIEDEDVLGDIQISSADGYLTNRRVSVTDERGTLLIPYDEYNGSGYYDEIIVSTPTRELKSDEYEIWLRPYMDGDICVRVDEGTIETVKPGMVLATVQSAVSCQVWKEFYIASAGNSSSQLLGTHIPITKIGKLDANFYTAGMYVENYRVDPIYRLDDNGNILDVEEFSVSMDVYNSTAIYGAIDVYDANMQYLSSTRIDKFKLSEENLREVFWEAYGLISDAVEGEFLTYRQNSASAHTSISQLKVPKGGYIVISNNCNESVGAYIYNWTDFFVEGFSAVENSISLAESDWNKVSNSFADALLDTLEGKQESLIGEFLMDFAQKVNQNYEWSGYSEYVEKVMNTGIATFMERNKTDIKELFKDCMIEAAGDQVAGMTEEAFLNALGPAGQLLNFSFTAFDLMNYGIQVDHFRESPEAKSINIQYPNKW